MNRAVVISVIVIIVLFLGGFLFLNTQTTPPQEDSQVTQNITPIPTPTTSATQSATTPTETTDSKTAEVTLTANGFTPQTITITPGTTVVWTNNSGAAATVDSDPHPVHTSYRPLNLESFADGGTLELTFPNAGTYHYHDHFHPDRTGTIIVK